MELICLATERSALAPPAPLPLFPPFFLLPLVQREAISRGAITTHCFSLSLPLPPSLPPSLALLAETLDVLLRRGGGGEIGWDGNGMRTMIFQPFNFNPLSISSLSSLSFQPLGCRCIGRRTG